MNESIIKTLFPDEYEQIINGQCPICRLKIKFEDFKNEISKKEFTISGMCQFCQDGFFDSLSQ